MRIKWNVVFHERLYEDLYEAVSKEELKEYFQFVAVNDRYSKIIPEKLTELVRYERDFPNYFPMYQMCRFNEASVFFHYYYNQNELKDIDFIGFMQYDMNMSKETFEMIKSIKNGNNPDDFVILGKLYPFVYLYSSSPFNKNMWAYVINHYSKFYNVNICIEDIENKPLPLLSTFGISKNNFLRMMPWINNIVNESLRLLNFDVKHLAGTIERFFALWLACELHLGHFKYGMQFVDIDVDRSRTHQDDYKSFKISN